MPALADPLQYHDDGEGELDELVGTSTWSLGDAGEMSFRIKKRLLCEMTFVIRKPSRIPPFVAEATYDPTAEVVMGSDFWEERIAVNSLYHPLTMGRYKAEKARLFREMNSAKPKRGLAASCLKLHLRHGDFVVMHGANIHAFYEVRLPLYMHPIMDYRY